MYRNTATLHNAIFIRKSTSCSETLLSCCKILENIHCSKSIEYRRSVISSSPENISIQHPFFDEAYSRKKIPGIPLTSKKLANSPKFFCKIGGVEKISAYFIHQALFLYFCFSQKRRNKRDIAYTSFFIRKHEGIFISWAWIYIRT